MAVSAPVAVGFIGLGNLGSAMVERLLAVGHPVAAYDPRPEALAGAAGLGARAATGPGDTAVDAAVVCVAVRDDAQSVEVVTGADGVLAHAAPGTVVALHATVAPSTVVALAEACRSAGCDLVDAGLSGGPDRALAGDLVSVVGGDPEAVRRAEPVLRAYASDVICCGPSGAGMAAKLARNLAQYGIWCALHEGMDLAASAGVDLELFARYVRASGLPTNHDVVLGRRSARPLDPATVDPAELDRLRWAVALGDKDLDDAFELADDLGCEVPVGRVARHRFAWAMGLVEDR
ncbi:MAG TPA: NAD(P)-dependent oxidoreductase [Iamia sp.]|nr:NAD(P)-dependent oxidoreductase [Iamia sp.]